MNNYPYFNIFIVLTTYVISTYKFYGGKLNGIKDSKEILEKEYNKENANVTYSNITLEKELQSYWQRKIYLSELSKDVSSAHLNGDIHIHDMDFGWTRANCIHLAMDMVFKQGFNAIQTKSTPTSKLKTAVSHVTNAISLSQGNLSGGQGFPLANVYLAPFCEGLDYKQIKNNIKGLIFQLNQISPSRGLQASFSTLNCELGVPKFLQGETVGYGKHKNNTFGDYQDESQMILKALCEVFKEGDGEGKPFLFPNLVGLYRKDTYNEELFNEIIDTNLKSGNGYFLNKEKYGKDLATVMGAVSEDSIINIRYKDKQMELRFYKFWELMSYDFAIKQKDASEYMELKDVEIYDIEKGFVKCKRIMRNHSLGRWLKIKSYSSTNKEYELMITDNHPLPIKNKGRTFGENLEIGDEILTVEGYLTIDEIDDCYEENWCKSYYLESMEYDVETESDKFMVNGIQSHNCRSYLDDTFSGDWRFDCVATGNFEYVTWNLPRVAMKYDDIEEGMWDLAYKTAHALLVRRQRIHQLINSGAYPFYDGYQEEIDGKIRKMYNIEYTTMGIGFVGLADMITLMNEDYDSDKRFEILKMINKIKDEFNNMTYEELAYDVGVEYTGGEERSRWSIIGSPAESCATRLFNKDMELYETEMKEYGLNKKSYYTNSGMMPEDVTATLFEKVNYEAPSHKYCGGGAITHIWNVGSNSNVGSNMVKNLLDKTDLRYMTFSPVLVYCPICKKYENGNKTQTKCNTCGCEDIKFYTKVSGYLQEVSRFNDGKIDEYNRRQSYTI